jgi:16S rRNA (uracil1498-N3)-methyltransferase
LTELGVTAFVPLHTTRSVVHPRETKLDKLQRHVIEASKQCGRNVLLEVRPMVDWSDYCLSADLPAHRLLAHPGGEKRCQEPFFRSETVPDTFFNIVAAVGPEGGFTDEEVALARAAGWRVVDLGPRILRVETAAMALAVMLGQ